MITYFQHKILIKFKFQKQKMSNPQTLDHSKPHESNGLQNLIQNQSHTSQNQTQSNSARNQSLTPNSSYNPNQSSSTRNQTQGNSSLNPTQSNSTRNLIQGNSSHKPTQSHTAQNDKDPFLGNPDAEIQKQVEYKKKGINPFDFEFTWDQEDPWLGTNPDHAYIELPDIQTMIYPVNKNANTNTNTNTTGNTSLHANINNNNSNATTNTNAANTTTGTAKKGPLYQNLAGFFWLWPCHENPDAPVLCTFIGGPGYPVLLKAFGGCNPLDIDENHKCLKINPNSLASSVHLLYIEHPIGSGYSLNKKTPIKTNQQDQEIMECFFKQLLNLYPHFREANWYFNGESFCGLSIPIIALNLKKS